MRLDPMRLILTGFALVVGVAGVAATVTTLNNRSAADTARVRNAPPVEGETAIPITPAPIPQSEEDIVVERVTILPYGFEPEEITRPVGAFLLAVDNRAGPDEFSFQLVSSSSQLVHSAAIQRGQAQTQKLLNLAPGSYVLRKPGHPKWTCTITITPN